MATVYYVEDDENIRELTLYALRHSDLEARGFPSVAGFFEACSEQRPDIILLVKMSKFIMVVGIVLMPL